MQIIDIQRLNVERANRWHKGDFFEWNSLEWAGAMCGEAGEAANIAKKIRRIELGYDGNQHSDHPVTELHDLKMLLEKECGDVFLYLCLLASRNGLDLEKAIRRVFNAKSEEMGFPERI